MKNEELIIKKHAEGAIKKYIHGMELILPPKLTPDCSVKPGEALCRGLCAVLAAESGTNADG